jgi:hypothetical protein
MGMNKKTINKRKWLAIALIALVHFCLSISLLLISFGSTMERFDSGDPATFSEQIIDIGVTVLNFPLVTLALIPNFLAKYFSGAGGWFVFIANSLLWGISIYTLNKFFKIRNRI